MNLQIVMQGSEEINTLNSKKIGINDYASVLNFKSNKKFSYYLSDKPIKFVIRQAVKNASSDITHILFLSSGLILEDSSYSFEEEGKHDIYTDSEDWNNRKVVLVKVTKDSRLNLDTLSDVAIGNFRSAVINYEPKTEEITMKLLNIGCDFNRSVAEINSLFTMTEREKASRIFIGTPSNNNTVSCNYTGSLIRTIELLKIKGIDCEIRFTNSLEIDHSLNILAHHFLSSSCTHLFLLNPDIVWNPNDVFKLIGHKKDICVGLYSQKIYSNIDTDNVFKKVQYSSVFFNGNNTMDENKLMEIKYGASGFMLIQRNVFEELLENSETYTYNGMKIHNFFNSSIIESKYLTKEFSFCDSWRKKKGKIWADLSICLDYEGWHNYRGNPLQTFSVE